MRFLYLRVTTLIGLERFEVEKYRFWSGLKSAENRAASSLWVGSHRCARILCETKLLSVFSTLKLENLAAATASLSDLTILSFEKNNSLPFLNFTINLGENSLGIPIHFCWVNSPMGMIFPPSCRPSSSWLGRRRRRVGRKKVASIWLKIGLRLAYG